MDDESLKDVHYKSETIVQEIMELSQTIINNGVAENVEKSGLQEGKEQPV